MSINSAFRFHKVGQGLFYSGLLSKKDGSNHSIFSFVYDCGTSSPMPFLQQEIDDYKLLLKSVKPKGNKKLDLLVISHLHDDHVNGLEYLLKDVDVDTVVMPYVYDVIKVLACLESDSDSDFLQKFYTDPIAWFASKGVKRVLLLGAEDVLNKLDDSSDGSQQNSDDLVMEISNIIRRSKYSDTDEMEIIYLRQESCVAYNEFYWEFIFENLAQDKYKINSYIDVIDKYKRENDVTLEAILKSKQHLRAFKGEIKELFPNNILNRTSVVLLHRPMDVGVPIWRNPGYYKSCSWYEKKTSICIFDIKVCGTILTGDIELQKADELNILNKVADKGSVHNIVLQYPHHGAHNEFLNYFKELHALNNVISYGLANKYGHPHIEVLQLCNVILVNEREAFNYEIYV